MFREYAKPRAGVEKFFVRRRKNIRDRILVACKQVKQAVVAQLVEHVIGNDEVIGSIPINGSV